MKWWNKEWLNDEMMKYQNDEISKLWNKEWLNDERMKWRNDEWLND